MINKEYQGRKCLYCNEPVKIETQNGLIQWHCKKCDTFYGSTETYHDTSVEETKNSDV